VSDPISALCRDCLWMGAEPTGRLCPRCGSRRLVRHGALDRLTIAHIDCDAFYASVEKRDRPELRERPVLVGGAKRGVVTTACYIARLSGVRSAMPMFKALKLCPDAVVIRPDFAKYRRESARIMAKIHALTPLVQPLSLDEAWLDLSGCERLHGGPAAWVLARLQGEIEADVGITVSVGLAPNKFLAKIASDLDKPRGFSVIGADEAQAFLAPRSVAILPGVGPAMARSLEGGGWRTVGDLARADPKTLARRFGAYGLTLSRLAHGQDGRPVNPDQVRKGISAETTFEDDLAELERLEHRLWPLCERVARTCRQEGTAARTVILKLKTADFRLITRRRTLPSPTQTASTLFAATRELLATEANGRSFRLIGVGVQELTEAQDGAPEDLFGSGESRALKGERAMDALRERFGADAVLRGRALKPRG